MWYRENETDNEKQSKHWLVTIISGEKNEFLGKLP